MKQRKSRQEQPDKKEGESQVTSEKSEVDDASQESIRPSTSHHKHHHHHKHKQEHVLVRNQYPVPLFDTICLVISSMFFTIPGLQAFYCGMNYYGVLSFLTSAISVNYWYYATPGWRRTLDLYAAKISFVIYFITGALYVTDPVLLVVGWPICLCILLCYWMSGKAWNQDSWTWVLFHMGFHFFVAIEQAIVITGSFEQCYDFKAAIHNIWFSVGGSLLRSSTSS